MQCAVAIQAPGSVLTATAVQRQAVSRLGGLGMQRGSAGLLARPAAGTTAGSRIGRTMQPPAVFSPGSAAAAAAAAAAADVTSQPAAAELQARSLQAAGGLEGLPQPLPPALVAELAEGLETPVQLIYLLTLLGFLTVGAFLVVRQVLIRRELEEAAKVLGDRIRTGQASSEDYFELGVILLRKKLFTQATKNLERARKEWEGEPEELAQVHNALGYAYFNMERVDAAVESYRQAVALQPGYVTAWNNLGDAYEKQKAYKEALAAYQEALTYDPRNKVAQSRADFCRTRLQRIGA